MTRALVLAILTLAILTAAALAVYVTVAPVPKLNGAVVVPSLVIAAVTLTVAHAAERRATQGRWRA